MKSHENALLDDLYGEVWVNIIGHPNYQVSNFQRIKSLSRKWDSGLGWEVGVKTKIIKGSINNLGYRAVHLFKNDKYHQVLVHRIIAKAFIPNPENKPNINHKNGIKDDNNIGNLEWCTQSENVKHSYNSGLQIGKGVRNELHPKSKPCMCINTGQIFPSVQEAGRVLKSNSTHIASVCRGERKTTGKLSFKYI